MDEQVQKPSAAPFRLATLDSVVLPSLETVVAALPNNPSGTVQLLTSATNDVPPHALMARDVNAGEDLRRGVRSPSVRERPALLDGQWAQTALRAKRPSPGVEQLDLIFGSPDWLDKTFGISNG
jgi:hypothetical protein